MLTPLKATQTMVEGTPQDNAKDEDVLLPASNFVRRPAAPRRETMMDRILRPEMARTDATIYREQPKYDEIKLQTLSVRVGFACFLLFYRLSPRHFAYYIAVAARGIKIK
jgi:hypothetical protein